MVLGVLFCDETKALEHSAVTKKVGIFGQSAIVPVVVGKVGGDAVGNVLAAAANGWVVEHVDDSPVDIGHHDP